ncbi:Hpt domain-containing protein [Myxococcota bacterium]|nr:Hpt domain-containing protein [Myxococcota bacterium]
MQELIELGRELEQDVLGEVVAAYRAIAPELFAEMSRAWETRSFDRIRKAAHTLKGASAQMGANLLSELARSIEFAARDGQEASLASLIERGLEESMAVESALSTFLEKQS